MSVVVQDLVFKQIHIGSLLLDYHKVDRPEFTTNSGETARIIHGRIFKVYYDFELGLAQKRLVDYNLHHPNDKRVVNLREVERLATEKMDIDWGFVDPDPESKDPLLPLYRFHEK